MTFSDRLGRAKTLPDFAAYGRLLVTALARTFGDQMATHKQYGSANEPSVRVQNVSVQDGGRAIVGNVTQNVGIAPPPDNADRAPLTVTDAKLGPPLLAPKRQRVPRVRLKKNG
jgi:hypothetical protein